jgi:fluoroquinolone resistance protein
MPTITHHNQIFEKITYSGQFINGHEFQECIFKQCDMSGSDFSNTRFIDCRFEGCNLSMMKPDKASLNNAIFVGCKLLGVNFHECSDFLFSVNFTDCILDFASFAGKKMLKTSFVQSSLKETSFMQANLAGSRFDECNLTGAVFNRTDLSSVNFSTAYHYTIDPEINILKKAVFAESGLIGLLTKHQIRVV